LLEKYQITDNEVLGAGHEGSMIPMDPTSVQNVPVAHAPEA
jgi:hypothetical protein